MEADEFNRLLRSFNTDASAFRGFYLYVFPKIKLHIARRFPDINSDDVAQDFFLKLIEKDFTNYPYIRYPASWMYKIADNIAKTQLCGKNFAHEIPYDEISGSGTNPYEEAMRKDEVRRLMSHLNPEEQNIFYLYYWEGYTLREIAGIIGRKASYVKQRHWRGIKKLKKFSFECNQTDDSIRLYNGTEKEFSLE